jgi:crotonobetainyl-CoA:carnitine CoA-transferase CaiB-like acyl-CoA transferase
MSITGPAESPFKVGVAVVDIMTGMYASTAILSALLHRFQSGMGQKIDISYL